MNDELKVESSEETELAAIMSAISFKPKSIRHPNEEE